MNLHRILSTSAVVTAAVLLSVGAQTFAYTAPSAGPTGGDAYAPINTGPSTQTKTGNLQINGYLHTIGLATLGGGVHPQDGIGAFVNGKLLVNSADLVVPDAEEQGAGVVAHKYCFASDHTANAAPVNCITAWPAGIDTSTFINTGSTAQTKSGSLTLSTAAGTNALAVVGGNILINTGGLELRAGDISVGTYNTAAKITSPKYCIGASCITAWPAAIDTATFLNTGAAAQAKSGNLTVSALTLSTAASFASPAVAVYNGGRIQVGATPAAVSSHTNIGFAVYGANQIKYWDGTTNTNNMVLAANASGVATWKDPATLPTVQRRVAGTCSNGSSIIAINADGTATCGPRIIAGSGSYAQTSKIHTVTFPNSQSMGSTNYAVHIALTYQSGGGNCTATYVIDSEKTSTSFKFQTADNCDATGGYIYDWIAVGY